MNSVSPVFTQREIHTEQVIALGQEEFYPIITARIRWADGTPASVVRFRLNDREREAIARGADLIISQPHHDSMMPMGLQLAFKDEYPLEGLE